MPLEEEKDIPKKEEGGEKLDQEAIRNIASAVKHLIDQDKEKEKVSQELGEMKKLLCAPNGGPCFLEKKDFDQYMSEQAKKDEERRQEQKERLDGFGSKVEAVVNQIKTMAESKTPAPEGPALVGIPKEGFAKLPEDQQAKLKGQVARVIPHGLLYDILDECSHSDDPKRCDLAGKLLKSLGAEELVAGLSTDKKGAVGGVICKDGQCRIELEKGEGMRIFKENPKTKRWEWVDQKEEPGDKGGFSVF